jgi:hypothetical protein
MAAKDARDKSQMVTRKIILRINKLCKANDITLIVAGITKQTVSMLKFCNENNIPTVDISVKLYKDEMSNLPYDGHPGAKANKIFAEKLVFFLKSQGI